MKINRKNYEIYILDYLEGNLPSDLKEDFVSFLNNNTDIREQISDLQEYNLEEDFVLFDSKDLLKKDPEFDLPGMSKFELLSIASLEDELLPNQKKQLDELLTNSENKRLEYQIFQKTKLEADLSIVYPNKNRLKHALTLYATRRIYFISAIAASVLIVLGFLIFSNSDEMMIRGMALNNNVHINPSPVKVKTEYVALKFENKEPAKDVNSGKDVVEVYQRDSNLINIVSSKILANIDNKLNNEIKLKDYNLNIYTTKPAEKEDKQYLTLTEYLNKKFKQKVLKQPADQKTTIASVGNAFSRILSKITKKEIKLDKKIMEDGSTLYAFKAGSVEIYTSIKPGKKSEYYNNERNSDQKEIHKE